MLQGFKKKSTPSPKERKKSSLDDLPKAVSFEDENLTQGFDDAFDAPASAETAAPGETTASTSGSEDRKTPIAGQGEGKGQRGGLGISAIDELRLAMKAEDKDHVQSANGPTGESGDGPAAISASNPVEDQQSRIIAQLEKAERESQKAGLAAAALVATKDDEAETGLQDDRHDAPRAPAVPASIIDFEPEKPSLFNRLFEKIAPFIVWGSMGCVVASVLYALTVGVASGVPWLILLGGLAGILLLMIGGAVTKSFSPLMLAGVLMHRAAGNDKTRAVQLAGKDILEPLGLAEDILNADKDARLVTTREGVVVYANEAYQQVAEQAGIRGTSGLPPRIDRLFNASGPESRKVFRLCRAAKSGQPTEEIITQMMGAEAGAARLRRFEISLRPMRDKAEHIAWRLREQEVEDVVDTLTTAYRKYPRPVFGLERSGQIVWYNEAMAEWVGAIKGSLQLSDFILGEADDIVKELWDENEKPTEARMRKRAGGAVDISLTPFLRGGVGEGFVCIELQPVEVGDAASRELASASGDMTEAPFGIAVVEGDIGSDARLAEINRVFADLFEIEGNNPLFSECFSEQVARDLAAALKARNTNSALARPVEVKIGDGAAAKFVNLYARPVKRRRGSYGKRQTVLYSVDVSFQKRMEEDYSQDQKLKTIGHLAGSIAHDFNNLLLVIMGSCEFLMRRHAAGDPSYPDLVLIQQNAQRAKNLTSNLLAFSRKQTLQSEVLSVTEMLRDFSPFLNRSITERVTLNVVNGRGLPRVKADKGQLELAVMNLAVNARDAMPKGGELTIETILVKAPDVASYGYAVLDDVDQVLIEVSDSGTGVPEDIAEKIFEPFFTTKGEGKGTGLGLSTVYGVIGQMGGRIFLHNRPGEGATFRIFLPASYEEETTKDVQSDGGSKISEATDLTGKGRILIVEDEDGARTIVVRALQMCGYEIVEATDGEEAMDILDADDKPFDLVLSDIMMPEMDGPTFIQEAGERLGKAKVIFMSGYAETAMRDKLEAIEGAGYLQKPFSLKTVAAKVKEALAV
ncbi:ATP-binding protein [Aquisalinus flavus]|uniref:histidine kinase n=1 Tax=Aquisalinus flavus TaxID=1526572 RepID=A0A8J2V3X8_9PROT|nr:ATP-binding protein [Aquisalinus flavus]MBD0427357.1 response regulator [Aquisalinus flavus]UNE47162.1 response regulator [Aquisalinus flavus]GGD00383.1 hypothetical protein GCM10011342_06720 [Aquisalinus flavus]